MLQARDTIRVAVRSIGRWRLPLRVGVWLTLVFCVVAAVYSIADASRISKMQPQDIGQFTQGVFAPLAFLWLVVAVFLQMNELELQREELKHSRRALELQAAELHLVEENKQSVAVANSAFEEQRRKAAEERLHALLDGFAARIAFSADALYVTYQYTNTPHSDRTRHILGNASEFARFNEPQSIMRSAGRHLSDTVEGIFGSERTQTSNRGISPAARTELNAILKMTETLARARERTRYGDGEVSRRHHAASAIPRAALPSHEATQRRGGLGPHSVLTPVLNTGACR